MEDIMQFLLIVGIIAFGIFRQYSKEKAKKSENEHPMPIPEYKMEEFVMTEAPPKQIPKKQKQVLPQEGARTTSHTPLPTAPVQRIEVAEESEFTIHSAEEARRAIIWSEILQRKF